MALFLRDSVNGKEQALVQQDTRGAPEDFDAHDCPAHPYHQHGGADAYYRNLGSLYEQTGSLSVTTLHR